MASEDTAAEERVVDRFVGRCPRLFIETGAFTERLERRNAKMRDVMTVPEPNFWTYEHYALLPEDGKRHEIIHGEHFVTPAPKTTHQRLLARLLVQLNEAAEALGAGEVLCAPCDVVFSNRNVVQPDLLYISGERSSIVTEANIQGAPDLLVEILSASTRKKDEVIKRDLYASFDVSEYWIVDLELETIKVYRDPRDGKYVSRELLECEASHSITTERLPDLDLALVELFR